MQSPQKGQCIHWKAAAIQSKIKQQNNEEATTSTIVTEDIEREQLEIDKESSEETAPDICVTFKLLR